MRDYERVDATTYALRIGCGTMIGAVIGVFAVWCATDIGVFDMLTGEHGIARGIIAVIALPFTVFAARFGDRPYDFLLRIFGFGRGSRFRD